MDDALKQFQRVCRFLVKVESNRNQNLIEYEDDVWGFFQNCWHLKDWIKNDSSVPEQYREAVERDAGNVRELKICADLCNRSKHLLLTRCPRMDADVSSRNTIINASMNPDKAYGELEFVITVDDGTSHNVIQVARDAVEAWRRILRSYGATV